MLSSLGRRKTSGSSVDCTAMDVVGLIHRRLFDHFLHCKTGHVFDTERFQVVFVVAIDAAALFVVACRHVYHRL